MISSLEFGHLVKHIWNHLYQHCLTQSCNETCKTFELIVSMTYRQHCHHFTILLSLLLNLFTRSTMWYHGDSLERALEAFETSIASSREGYLPLNTI